MTGFVTARVSLAPGVGLAPRRVGRADDLRGNEVCHPSEPPSVVQTAAVALPFALPATPVAAYTVPAKMQWWYAARFGMLIHFGSYSYHGLGEWAFFNEEWSKVNYQTQTVRSTGLTTMASMAARANYIRDMKEHGHRRRRMVPVLATELSGSLAR